ncbi:hypothetical protein ACFLTX_02940 [Chloroflexota bacterium]
MLIKLSEEQKERLPIIIGDLLRGIFSEEDEDQEDDNEIKERIIEAVVNDKLSDEGQKK